MLSLFVITAYRISDLQFSQPIGTVLIITGCFDLANILTGAMLWGKYGSRK